jgi:hypothetical protein
MTAVFYKVKLAVIIPHNQEIENGNGEFEIAEFAASPTLAKVVKHAIELDGLYLCTITDPNGCEVK